MASPSDLTTVAAVKAWQGLGGVAQDAVVAGLVTAASRAILAHLGRPIILPKVWTDRYDTRVGMRRLVLRNWPVISISAVQVGPTALAAVNPQVNTPPSPSAYPGYVQDIDPWGGVPPGSATGINFISDPSCFGTYSQQGVQVSYVAGYQDSATFAAPAGGGKVTAAPSYGTWASDRGVVYAATGVALTAVVGAPATGQYSVTPAGAYTFSVGDQNQTLVASFGYIPQDLAQACIETVAQRLVAGSRVGVKSKSLGGQETVSYDMTAIPLAVMAALQPYKRVMPL